MAHAISLGRIAGLRLTADWSAIVGSLLLWVLLSGIAIVSLQISPAAAITGGLIAVLLHWASDISCCVEIVTKPAEQVGFAVVPKRWVVERTFA